MSAGWQTASPDVALPSFVSGDIAAARATRLVARYQDGSSASIPFIFVSKPIAAGFFAFDIPLDHRRRGHALRELALLDSRGRTIARQTFDLRPPPIRPQPRSAAQRHPQRLPTTLPLRAPLQTGSADGVFVTVGANDVAVFRVRALDAERRRLLQRGASYGCFQIVRVFGFLEARGLGVEGAFAPVAAAGIYGVGEPVDGCDIEGTNGHRWPDVLRSHSPVEIPLTARGRRWFADRAAARDLALFVRSRQGHAFRHEQGSAVANAIHAFGRSRVVATTSPSAGLIGFTLTPHGVVLVETSETGHRFRVEIRNGRIVRQNLKPYAFVF